MLFGDVMNAENGLIERIPVALDPVETVESDEDGRRLGSLRCHK